MYGRSERIIPGQQSLLATKYLIPCQNTCQPITVTAGWLHVPIIRCCMCSTYGFRILISVRKTSSTSHTPWPDRRRPSGGNSLNSKLRHVRGGTKRCQCGYSM